METFDTIIIGAGMSGLYTALQEKKEGKNVLLLESENYIGGVEVSKVAGRFEFEPCYQSIYCENKKELSKILENKIIDSITLKPYLNDIKIHSFNENKTYTLPLNKDGFINAIEEYVPGSKQALEEFFAIALECKKGMEIIVEQKQNLDFSKFQENYPKFVRTAVYTVSQVLDSLELPLEAQNILNSFWMYFGNGETDLVFYEFAIFIYNFICEKVSYIEENTYTILQGILDEYLTLGGKIIYNSTVTSVDITSLPKTIYCNAQEYKAKKIFFNGIDNDFLSLIKEPSQNYENYVAIQPLSPSLFTISIGLNRSAKILGLTHSFYFFLNSFDSSLEKSRINTLEHHNFIVDVKEYKNETCILRISCLFAPNFYEENSSQIDKEDLAFSLLKQIEETENVALQDYIEEYKIWTPYDFPHVFGTLNTKHNYWLSRFLHYKKEIFLPNVYTCSGYSGDVYGYSNAYLTAQKIFESSKEIENETSNSNR